MQVRRFPVWQIVALIAVCIAVVSISAVALILGKDAIIAIAFILFLAVIGVIWLFNLF